MMTMERIAVIDIETTGFDRKNDLIVEVGIVELDPGTGETKILLDSVVKEKGFGNEYRDSWVFDNSDLKFGKVMKAVTLKSKSKEIQKLFDSHPITAFNSAFDLGFLRERGFKVQNELPCIMRTCTDIVRIPKPRAPGKYKWPKVQEAWDHFFPDTDYVEKHRAADDALHEAGILYKMISSGVYLLDD